MSELSIAESIKQDYEEEIERLKIIEEKYKDSQIYIKDFKDEIERLNNIIEKIRDYVYKPIDKEWDDILCIIEDGLRGSDKE